MARCVVILLVVLELILKTDAAHLECQPEAVQLITPSDVVDSSLLHGSEFEDILTVTEQNSVLLWGDNDIPNEGNLTFQQPFLLLAMTSMGDRITDNRFISNFSLQYSDSLNGSFHTYPRFFITDTLDETAFYLDKPILVKTLRLFINAATNNYYWRLSLIACPQINTTLIPDPTSISCAMSSTEISSYISTVTITNQCPVLTSTDQIIVTITETVTISSTPVITSIIDSQESNDNCQNVLIATGIIGSLSLLLLIITIVSVVVIIYQCLNRREEKRGRSGTLKEVSNIPLYSTTDNDKEEETMISNALYESNVSSLISPHTSELLNSNSSTSYLLAQTDNIYSEVDTYESTPLGGEQGYKKTIEQTPVKYTSDYEPVDTGNETTGAGNETTEAGNETTEAGNLVYNVVDNPAYYTH